MAQYAHLALQNHDMLPSDFMAMPLKDRAFLIASGMKRAEAVKAQLDKIRR